jgi:hypothetical protein
MNVGMLWFDDNPKTSLKVKIEQATNYYRKKYGYNPDICFVNPSALQGQQLYDSSICLKPSRSVLPHHFWLGLDDRNSLLSPLAFDIETIPTTPGLK